MAPEGRHRPRHADLSGLESTAGVVVHSTSRRHTRDAVVLSYAVVLDPDPRDARPVTDAAEVTWSPDPGRPDVEDVPVDAVVAHACRHLAFLLDHDPHVARAGHDDLALWSRIRRLGVGVAGEFPRAQHRATG